MTPSSYIRLALPVLAAVLPRRGAAPCRRRGAAGRRGRRTRQPTVALIVRPHPLDLRAGLYLSAGAFAAIERAAPNRLRVGLRLPTGLQLYVADDALEPFVDAVPILEIYPGLAFSRAALQGYEGLTIRLPGAKAGAG